MINFVKNKKRTTKGGCNTLLYPMIRSNCWFEIHEDGEDLYRQCLVSDPFVIYNVIKYCVNLNQVRTNDLNGVYHVCA